jgi:hypothetical protein
MKLPIIIIKPIIQYDEEGYPIEDEIWDEDGEPHEDDDFDEWEEELLDDEEF